MRLLLVWLLLRYLRGELRTSGITPAEAWARLWAAIDTRRWELLLQVVILDIALFIFEVPPNLAIANLVPEGQQDLATAFLVAVKNPTVIAFTFL